MTQILEDSFDFSIRAIELVRYLNEEKKLFPLSERFLLCATGIGISLRVAQLLSGKSFGDDCQALSYAVEVEYLLETMVATGCLQEKQSQPIIDDCHALKDAIAKYIHKMNVPPATT